MNQKIKKSFYYNGYCFIIFETAKYYWDSKQNSLIEYMYSIKSSLHQRKILVLLDQVGICSMLACQFGGKVCCLEQTDHIYNLRQNIDMNKLNDPPEFIHESNCQEYDFIIISEPFYSKTDSIFKIVDFYSNSNTKIILGVGKITWEDSKIFDPFQKSYLRRQVSKFNSKQNTIFELKKKKILWSESLL